MTKNHNGWGGARPGAGRKCIGDAPLRNYNIRMPADLIATCKSKGGGKYIRKAIAAYLDWEGEGEANNQPVDQNIQSSAEHFDFTVAPAMPAVEMNAACGYPSPAIDFAEEKFDLASYFVHDAKKTFVVTASGNSMINAGICDGDKLFIDQSIEPRPGHIVLALVDGGLTVKTLRIVRGRPELHPENPDYPVIRPRCLDDFHIQGVVVSIGRQLVH